MSQGFELNWYTPWFVVLVFYLVIVIPFDLYFVFVHFLVFLRMLGRALLCIGVLHLGCHDTANLETPRTEAEGACSASVVPSPLRASLFDDWATSTYCSRSWTSSFSGSIAYFPDSKSYDIYRYDWLDLQFMSEDEESAGMVLRHLRTIMGRRLSGASPPALTVPANLHCWQ